ncbi:hypothetical protein ACHAPO_010479 [Fusarium lateritium]
MDSKLNLTAFPSEIRQQIFGEYFKTDKGYAYNAQLDKLTLADEAHTPIDLSLRFTCRSIAEDTKNIPFAVNTIHFSTAFREDWRSLAGCFNLAATVYHLLARDFVLHLAEHITPDIYSELCSKFPTFGAELAAQATSHRAYVESEMEDERQRGQRGQRYQPVEDLDGDDRFGSGLSNHTHCISVTEFLRDNRPFRELLHTYRNFSTIHESYYQLFPDRSSDEGKYTAQDFLDLQPNHWDIPTRDDVVRMLEMLNIGDYVWNFPDIWQYRPVSFYEADDHDVSPRHLFPDAYLDPLKLDKRFDIRFREPIGFSATAAAIRFLGRLPLQQRTQIRRLILHENMHSVNVPSLHAQGLIPFFQENPTLQVERRVSVAGCIINNRNSMRDALREWEEGGRDDPPQIWAPHFTNAVSCWLLDGLAMLDSGISTESFTLVLEAGLHGNFGTEIFQRSIHRAIARSKAYFTCLEKGFFLSYRPEWAPERSPSYAIDERFEGAVQHLVSQTSILRCDFDPGTPENFQLLVDETAALDGRAACVKWSVHERDGLVDIPQDVYEVVRASPRLEVETWDDYLKAHGSGSAGPDEEDK